MKYFKHFSDMHRGRSINDLLDKLGHTGLCFFLLQEMCADKLEKPSAGEPDLEKSDCLFRFHLRTVRQNLRISPANLRRLLDVCRTNGLLSFEISGNQLEISMPILLDLLDRDSRKARTLRADDAEKSRQEKEKEKDTDKEKDVGTVVEKPTPVLFDDSCLSALRLSIPQERWDSWFELYGGRNDDFVDREIIKAWNYYSVDNPKKCPKSKRGWLTALSSWLERGWSYRAKNTQGVKAKNFKNEHLLDWANETEEGA